MKQHFQDLKQMIDRGNYVQLRDSLQKIRPLIEQANPKETEFFALPLVDLLLKRLKLELVDEILSWIPESHRSLKIYQERKQRHKYVESSSKNSLFFPFSIPWELWWRGPHLLPNRDERGREVTKWYAGRVSHVIDFIDQQELIITGALPPPKGVETPRFVKMKIPFANFNMWVSPDIGEWAEDLTQGRLIEIAIYGGDDKNPVIAAHPLQ